MRRKNIERIRRALQIIDLNSKGVQPEIRLIHAILDESDAIGRAMGYAATKNSQKRWDDKRLEKQK